MTELTLIHGDCIEQMKTIADKSIDLIICDLPYGCLYTGTLQYGGETKVGKDRTKSCAWDVKIDLELFWAEIRRIRKNERTPCIHFCTTKFGINLIQSNPSEFRYDLVWNKMHGVSFLLANKMPMRSHEMIYVFSKKGLTYNRIDVDTELKPYSRRGEKLMIHTHTGGKRISGESGDGMRCVLSVIDMFKSGTVKQTHPTEKPVELYRWLIERYSNPGDTVLDPTFGSGNSVFTAYELGRNAIGIEKDEGFFTQAENRM